MANEEREVAGTALALSEVRHQDVDHIGGGGAGRPGSG
jgi:hypothetical protein